MGGLAKDGSYLEGPFGWARLCTPPPDHPNAATTLAAWFMHLPNQSVGWDKYMLGVITLEDVPGRPPARRQYPQAQFELMVAALNPDLNPRPDDVETWMPMQPLNFVGQFHGIGRDAAGRVARVCAAGCVTGQLMAETQLYVEPDGGEPKMMFIKQLVDTWKMALLRAVSNERDLAARMN